MESGRAGIGARESWLLGTGGAALLAGLAVFLAGPFDGSARRAAAEKLEDLKGRLEAAREEVRTLKARATVVRGQVRGADQRAAEGRRALDRLRNQKSSLEEIDGRLKALLAAQEASAGGPAVPAVEPPDPGLPSADPVPERPASGVERAEKAVFVIRTDLGSGSGFIVEAGGLAVTSYHVVEASSKLEVEIQKGDSSDTVKVEGARVMAVDADRDLALIILPPPPAPVAAKGLYRALELRAKPEVTTGETVYALGNPGAGGKVLSYTLTKGIVSNPARLLDGVPFIQTTAPINPGNSGGPLLDKQGKAVGVVAAKGRNVEAVGFAIPARAVKDLLARRSEAGFAVAAGLEEWEKKNRPLTALARRGPSYREDLSIKVEGRIDRIIPSPRGGTVYLVDAQAGTVSRFNLSSRSVEATFRADTPLAAADLDPGASVLYLAAPEKKSVLRVAADSMKLKDESAQPVSPLGVAWAGEAEGALCVLQAGAAPRLLLRRDFQKREEAVELEADLASSVCASSGRWLCLARRTSAERDRAPAPVELIAYRSGDLKKVQELAALRREAKKKDFPSALVTRIAALQKEVDASRRLYSISDSIAEKEGGIAAEIVFAGEEKVIFGRRLFGLGPSLRVEGTFDAGPYSQDDRPELKKKRDFYLFMDNVFSASPDGKYAATGTHIYSVKGRKPIRLLPFPTRVHAFSRDGRSLYLFDPYRNALYLLIEWEANAAKP